ncbi:hypothetical protein G7Y89_g12918 [Cudoniella acicularis]|uniref:Major facilitator superfamily (MFS) profile domain-containing protein n=1 Tax=Cudoniella acicularis TaxID=354080 RepID=A0A8H4R8B1_9HELO|nr:hypothetical protein G7Y89_g12918 [Cudoniella acicularis]
MALTARVLAGAGNGVVGIIRTMVAEMCPWKELQPVAFSIMPLVYNVGSVIGPAFGGALSNPYNVSPDAPPGTRLFERFPYALPNIIAACFFLVGIVIGGFFLHETLPGRKDDKDVGLQMGERISSNVRGTLRGLKNFLRRGSFKETKPLLDSGSHASFGSVFSSDIHDAEEVNNTVPLPKIEEHVEKPRWRDVLSPQSSINLLVYALICMHSMAYDQLLPVFMHHPVQDMNSPEVRLPYKFNSGFGIDSGRIGTIFTLYGIASMFFQFFIFPRLANRFGLLTCLKACSIVFPITYFISPFTTLLPTAITKQAGLLAIWLVKGLCVTIAFPSSTILLTNSVSSTRLLATLNGVATTVSAIGRALGPSITGPMFTMGVDNGYIIVPFWTLAAITALSAIPVFYLLELDGFGSEPPTEEASTDDDEEENIAISNTPRTSIDEDGSVLWMRIGSAGEEPEEEAHSFPVGTWPRSRVMTIPRASRGEGRASVLATSVEGGGVWAYGSSLGG